jgi:hypothetical protein|tara:strand:+ start:14658 stop:14834 length:177 start_codon:yes stop_codon:yes gene_type:complete
MMCFDKKFEQALKQDPSTSFWLKEQLQVTKARDILDALNDAEALVNVLKTRYQQLVKN